MTPDSWQIFPDAAALGHAAAQHIVSRAAQCVRERGIFRLALPGGRTPVETFRHLRHAPVDWSEWQIYFGDERCLAAGDAERNDSIADEHWLRHIKLSAEQINRIPAELGPERAARAYADTLAQAGQLDLVLLGLGEDGHTASLFPGALWGSGEDAPAVLAVEAAPKPPEQRVSLSARSINAATSVLVLAAGEGKSAAVAQWCRGEHLPVAAIRPAGPLHVMLTTSAAGNARWPNARSK